MTTITGKKPVTIRLEPDLYERLRTVAYLEELPLAIAATRLIALGLDLADADRRRAAHSDLPLTQQDIGQCDDCSSDTGPRIPSPRNIIIAGKTERVVAWLCRDCWVKAGRP